MQTGMCVVHVTFDSCCFLISTRVKELSSNKGGGDGGVIFSAAPPTLSDDPSPQSSEEQQYYKESSAEVPSSPVHTDLQYLHRSLQKVTTILYA